MTSLSNLSVLIVDPSGEVAFELRQTFIEAGAATHVVASFLAAQKLLDAKKIDAVVLPYSKAPETVDFCKALVAKSIPSVFTSEPPPRYPTHKAMSAAIAGLHALVARQGMKTYLLQN